ncbi:aldehyde dehydrogenase [Alicyclobacillus cellulosilyticus]|uniref:Aldehyde dehydrogenase n=1 Tax=Alicyclobacillus cellulosilyticus TaxID=1003997 RepID=A0A917KEL9_9BACL|nr:aldehyde dehydrogenase family protein [Alicyclobacillus cellulosilyticus]GGJ08278.1 aldehyde dehydrogenase [Alicyclobacillus cellulosilyticus]
MNQAQGNGMQAWLAARAGETCLNFIGGQWVPAASGRLFAVHNPAEKDQVVAYVQDSDERDVDAAVRAAREALPGWASAPWTERARVLLRLAELLEAHRDELAYTLSAEQGKVLGEARGEVTRAASELRFMAGEAARLTGEVWPSDMPGGAVSVVREPVGVVAAISPWNFPLVTPVRKIAPALAYGCTVVLKPASQTPWTAVRLMELIREAGAPPGVVNLVTGRGSRMGDALVNHPGVDAVTFTGSTEVGLRVQALASGRLVRTQMELGGKNPALILGYSHLDAAAREVAAAGFTCGGQRCTAISRVIVLRAQAEAFMERLLHHVARIRVGPAWDEGATMGPLVSASHLQSVLAYVEQGIADGARLVTGGRVLTGGVYDRGHYLEPTVFAGVTPTMRIAREEIFGPVLSVLTVADVEEAVAVANDTPYGLAASVFADDLALALAVGRRLKTGMVHINHGTASQAHIPFGGVKQSGYGAYSVGATSRDFYTDLKVVYVR